MVKANVETRRDEYTSLRKRVQHTNTSSTSGGSTTSTSLSILSRSGRAMAHDEVQERHSAVKQKPVDSLKNTHFLVVAPRLEFVSFEGRVRNVAVW